VVDAAQARTINVAHRQRRAQVPTQVIERDDFAPQTCQRHLLTQQLDGHGLVSELGSWQNRVPERTQRGQVCGARLCDVARGQAIR
jgi:hypothetical protein